MTAERSIPLARPSFDADEERRIRKVLRSGWVTQGPRVAEFEERFAATVGADCAVATSSCTTALHLSLRALGLGPGDEVIAPAATYIATINSIVHAGATPVLVDVDPRTYNLDPSCLEAAISPRTRAVMVVHQLGLPADLDAIDAIATRHELLVVEDAACALGAHYRGRPVGSSGRLVCFSFHPRKVIVTGEGGMITTGDARQAARLRRLRHQGMSMTDFERHRADRVVTEVYDEIGYNFRMSDLHAAIGLAQLDKLERLLARRRRLAARYDAAFASDPRIDPPFVPDYAEASYQSYIVRFPALDARRRDALLDAMRQRGVATRRGLMAVHREPAHRGTTVRGSLENSEAVDDGTAVLPIHGELSDDDQDYVIEMLRASLDALGLRA